ncbi:hypothetical protein [Streptomyces sp. NPDC047000]|uniref:hypothetical protein n=1 Tax=Streptomyces sp. NPDC047000 TaxID=3155474 RepID=UPI0033FB46F1
MRGLGRHDFDVHALSCTARRETPARRDAPARREAAAAGRGAYGRRARRRFAARCADLVRDTPGLTAAPRPEDTVRALERACRAPRAVRAAHEARVPGLLTVATRLGHTPRPLSPDRYGDDALGRADLCHAASGGTVALPGLLARHFWGVPPLVTEYTVPLRTHRLTARAEEAHVPGHRTYPADRTTPLDVLGGVLGGPSRSAGAQVRAAALPPTAPEGTR